MKLIITILPDDHTEPVSKALTAGDLRVTQIASTGGFLRKGASTLLIGVEDGQVERAIEIIKVNSHLAKEKAENAASNHETGKTTIFVLNVSQFIQI
ncbi:MAG: cyclic-di-AMP receptor [Anaerolineaceae bacterium]